MKHALRSLAKSPGFTAIALLTLAFGIGVNTSMFSLLDTLLFHAPSYAEPGRLVRIYRTGVHYNNWPHSVANFLDYRAQARSIENLAAFVPTNYGLAGPGQPAESLQGMDVTADFFATLGVQPALGRTFTEEEDQPGRNQVVILSDTFWRRRFGADPGIVGRQIRLDGELVTVLGVMPAGFDDALLWGPLDAWRPIAFTPELRQNRLANGLGVIGRLAQDVTLAQAQAEMGEIAAGLARNFPDTNAQTSLSVIPLVRSAQDGTTRLLSWFAMGLAGCVLLIACVNLANLQFARNAGRAREHAIRAALGASRAHLIRQSLAESLLLSIAGGALGLLVALWCNDLLGARLGIAGRTGLELPLHWRVLGFAVVAALFSGVGFGLLPAVLASRTDVIDALKQGTRGSTDVAHHRLRHSLIVVEVALALVLLSGAGFFIRGLDRFAAHDHGWRTDRLLTGYLVLSPTKYPDGAAQVAFYERLQSRLASLPGVERAALARVLPFSGFLWSQRFIIEGRPLPKPGAELLSDLSGVSPEYFDTVGLPILEGRAFTAADISGPVRTIINETMARQLWPGESAIGKRIAHPVTREWQEIVGVVRDTGFATNLSNSNSRYQAYRLLAREPISGVSITLRSSMPPEALADQVRRTVAELDPDQPVQDIRPAALVINQGLANFTVIGGLLVGFALLGLLLAAIGIYGVIAGAVARRTNEIGIRMALGAQVRDVLALILGQGLRLSLLGAALGLAGAFAVARLLASVVPALPPAEPVTAACVTLALIATALLACWLPARKATKVDPLVALRAE